MFAAGGTAALNAATLQARGIAFVDRINDTFAPAGQQDVVVGVAYVFGNYTVGGGDVYAKFSAVKHTIYVRVLEVQPNNTTNFNNGNTVGYYHSPPPQ
jgi:hypothetical protein